MSILLDVWNTPSKCETFSEKEWELLVRQARASYLLARLYHRLFDHKQYCPERIWLHFEAANIMAIKQIEATNKELYILDKLFQGTETKAVILKGAAYSAIANKTSLGRTYNDIDLLVDKRLLKSTESLLFFKGFMSAKQDDYDKMYYRKWMHEIPPLLHISRKTVLDVHHNILPTTSLTKVNIEPILQDQQTLANYPNLFVLSEEARILHSATHLFHEGELEKGLRDLIDLELLLLEYLENNKDLSKLINLAHASGLQMPLFLAVRYVSKLFNLTIGDQDLIEISALNTTSNRLNILDFCFGYAFSENHSSVDNKRKKLALFVLYIRGHLLRMPLKLLLPHLCKKAIFQIRDQFTKTKDEDTVI